MELVRGMPITEAANALELGITGRLELAIHLCRAIHAAHASLIVPAI